MEEIRILGIAPFESIRAAMERVAREEFPAVRFEKRTPATWRRASRSRSAFPKRITTL